MPPENHAMLSASSSHRWLNCNPSARLELEFEDRGSVAAAEGTAAHALCEHKLKRKLKLRTERPVSSFDSDEMEGYTDDYADFVFEQVKRERRRDKDTLVLIEQRLDFSEYVPDGFGTGDCLIISKGRLHIIDFKYGQGVLVEAENNPQMKLYAIGALREFGEKYEIKRVKMTIFQPRRENVSTWEITVARLMKWAEKDLKPKAEKAPAKAKAEKAEPKKAEAKPKAAPKADAPKEKAKKQMVIPHKNTRGDQDGWQVKVEGSSKATKVFKTKAEAEAYAKELSKKQGVGMIRQKKDGKFQKK